MAAFSIMIDLLHYIIITCSLVIMEFNRFISQVNSYIDHSICLVKNETEKKSDKFSTIIFCPSNNS